MAVKPAAAEVLIRNSLAYIVKIWIQKLYKIDFRVFNMVTQQEIDRVIEWCEKVKAERNRIYVIERNPFRDEIDWMRRFILIEIDRPRDSASKNDLVYDSTIRQLWQFMNGDWRRVEPDIRIG